MYTRFLRDPGPGDAGGLGSLMNNFVDGINNPPQDKTADELAAEKLEQEQTALKTEALEADGVTLKPGYLKDNTGKFSKDPDYKAPDTEDDTPPEGVDADGNLLPGYKKDDDGKVIIDPDYKEPDLTPEQEAEAFFEKVNAITGDALIVEYPEGIDPLSPEGIAHYTQVVRDDAANMFEQYLAQKDPRAYAYMLHRNAGGTDEDFLTGHKGFVLPEQAEFDASADLQTAVFKYDLKVKGLDDETIEVLLKKAIADNKLKEKADAAYKLIDTQQKKQLSDITKQTEEADKKADTAITGFLGKVDKAINAELKFIIPEADKPVFRKFVVDNLRYDKSTGNFSLVQEIPDDQLNIVMEALFFQHKKGNLSALVQRQAKTIASQSLRLKTSSSGKVLGSSKSTNKDDNNFIPLSAMTIDN